TIIPSGLKQKQITTYFWHIATLSDISKIEEVHLQHKRDDGAAVYINGAEAARSNLTGPLHRQTLASTAQDDGKAFHHFTIPAKLLRKGNNIIAAEVHQQSLTSSDLSFDLELTAIKHNPKVPTNTLTLIGNTHIRSRARHASTWSALNETFFTSSGIAPGDVTLTEIHYHPQDDTETEFIELTNISSRTINLRGTAFTKGVNFRFPTKRDTLLAPNQRLLLFEDS
ncbi:MAG: lamin tail domain-containing protein, partial [Verrucomicrobiales bacterium]